MTEECWSKGDAESGDGLYRYRLWRRWGPFLEDEKPMLWIALNPSTADYANDDNTIRRMIGFAHREGCNAINVINLFALRTTQPKHLLDHPAPEGPENVVTWERVLKKHTGPIVAAWGSKSVELWEKYGLKSEALDKFAYREVHKVGWKCLGTNRNGTPCHPLYIAANTPLEAFT